ncbi:MAG: formate dehydrogenase accessory sulfurtransferase FdhD [Actinobacteria bacterium]|nr:formate dehydrogenase accessory sulfurtransferase FdhD [Actinomycetota bacterium]
MSDLPRPGPRVRVVVARHEAGRRQERADVVATEEPLEIRLTSRTGAVQRLAVTMRTPGADFELAVGFLVGEGVIAGGDAVASVRYCVDRGLDEDQRFNVVTVNLDRPELPDLRGLERHFTTTSACGVCGRSCLESLETRGTSMAAPGPVIPSETLTSLPGRLRAAQPVFDRTGGLHAAALFTAAGELVAVREDVGRHNAMDKLVGWAAFQKRLPLEGHLVLVSGRASYELVQKAATAGVPVLAAISAPSSLAIEIAERFGLTLVGFLRDDRFNVYSGEDRIGPAQSLSRRAAT